MYKKLPKTHPAQISRGIIKDYGDLVEIREVWDMTNKDCPITTIYPVDKAIRRVRELKKPVEDND